MRPVASILRTLGHTPPSGSSPDPATLAVTNDGDGDAVTATVSGGADGVTWTLYF